MKKKLFALLLSFAMLMNMVPPFGTIAAAAEDMSCEHHPVHTAECGYAPAVEAHDCTHVCGEDCQIENLSCAHTHDETCGYVPAVAEIPEVPCNFAHSIELCGENEETCPHAAHDESCGYIPAVPGTPEVPCGHEHSDACYTTVCSHQHDEACGYAEAVEGSPCTFVCPECSDKTDLGDVDHIRAKLIERLYGSADGWVVCDFDSYTTTVGRHEGIDFACAPETPIYAVVSGEIIAVSEGDETEPTSRIAVYSNDYDRTVFYFHADPMDTLTVGMWVEAGDLLGYEANRGSSDYHTHLELIPGRSELASISVNDDVLDNENPYPLWEEMLSESIADEQSAAVTRLYEAMYQETTLRGLFDLVNENTDALLGFTMGQVQDFEDLIYQIQAGTTMTQDEEEALEQLLDTVETLRSCPYCGMLNSTHTSFCENYGGFTSTPFSIAAPASETTVGESNFSKEVIEDATGNLAIQIEGWVEGSTTVVPSDIVIALDHSASVYSAVDKNEVWTWAEFQQKADKEKASQFSGYYIVVNKFHGTSAKDLNEQEIAVGDYCYALVRWNKDPDNNPATDDGRWERCYLRKIWETEYDDREINTSFWETKPLRSQYELNTQIEWYPIENNREFDGADARYYQSIYGATVDALIAFADVVKDIPDCRIAFTGFAGNKSNGTGFFLNQVMQRRQDDNGTYLLSDQNCKDAFFYTSDTSALAKVITNYIPHFGGTSTEEGIYLANAIFRQSPDTAERKPIRSVILFTDGIPGTYNKDDYAFPATGAYSAAIYAAYNSKTTYNATVYSVGPAQALKQAEGNQKNFMEYISSNYPNATTLEIPNVKTRDDCHIVADDEAGLEAAFKSLGEKIYNESLALNKNSEIRDTITPYFDLGGNYNGGKIQVLEIPYDGTGFDESNTTLLYEGDVNGNGDGEVSVKVNHNVAYQQTVVKNDGTTEEVTRYGDQVTVSGYDYGAKTVFPGENRGAKLRLLIPIEPNDYFVGGDYAVTNSPDSGVFPDSEADTPVGGDDGYFPPPHVDVEVKEDEVIEANVEARAGATYLEEIPYEDVLKLVHLTIKDNDDDDTNNIVLQMGVPNFGVDEWKTDYVFIEAHLYDTLVDANGELILDEVGNPQKGAELKENENLSVRRDHAVIAEVYIWSRYTYVNGEAVLQEQRPEDLKPATGIINLTVYYPTFVFNDVTLYHGQPLSLATEAWGEEMDATPYLQWYTNEEYENLLANPQPRTESPGYVPLSEGSWGKDTEVVVQETPEVYFKVDPIDGLLENADAHIGPVDNHFYEKYDTVMGKDPINMNVRVFYTNDNHPDYDPDNPEGSDSNFDNAMRNAFFLHVDNKGNSILKHTSGSAKHENVYWMPEFKILPAYCELTIEKIGGLPNETYVFDIARGQTNEYSLMTGEKIQSETEPTYYTTVSITTDANGYGKVTLKELPVGVYTVTEDLDWSWRFKGSTPTVSWKYENGTAGTGTKIYLLGNTEQDTATVTVTNSSPNDSWLSGMSAVVENIFGRKKQ